MSGNFNVLKYRSYDDYLNALKRPDDYLYLSNMKIISKLVHLGYRTQSKVLDENEFNKLRAHLTEMLNPKVTSRVFYSKYFTGTDPVLAALASREEANILLKLSVRQRTGFDISGYIDFEHSLRECNAKKPERTNWKAVFEGKVLLKPTPNDLSYYDWHKGTICHKDTDNYYLLHGGERLMFMSKHDHKFIPVTDKPSKFAENVIRTMIKSDLYGYIVLYDHVIR